MLVSGIQQSDSALCVYIYIFRLFSIMYRLLQDIEYCSPCYLVNLCCAFISFLKMIFKIYFIFGCAGSSLLWGLSLVMVFRLRIVVVSLVSEHVSRVGGLQ